MTKNELPTRKIQLIILSIRQFYTLCLCGTLCHLLLPVSCRGAILRPGSLQFPRWIATIVFGVGYMKSSASDSHFRRHARPLWTTRGPRRLTIYNGPSRCMCSYFGCTNIYTFWWLLIII